MRTACVLISSAALGVTLVPAADASQVGSALQMLRQAPELHATVTSGSTRMVIDQNGGGQRTELWIGDKLRRITYLTWAQRPQSGVRGLITSVHVKELAFDRCFRTLTSANPWIADVTPFAPIATRRQIDSGVTPGFPRLKERPAGKRSVRSTFYRRLPGRQVVHAEVLSDRSTGAVTRIIMRKGSQRRGYQRALTAVSYRLRNIPAVPAGEICAR